MASWPSNFRTFSSWGKPGTDKVIRGKGEVGGIRVSSEGKGETWPAPSSVLTGELLDKANKHLYVGRFRPKSQMETVLLWCATDTAAM